MEFKKKIQNKLKCKVKNRKRAKGYIIQGHRHENLKASSLKEKDLFFIKDPQDWCREGNLDLDHKVIFKKDQNELPQH